MPRMKDSGYLKISGTIREKKDNADCFIEAKHIGHGVLCVVLPMLLCGFVFCGGCGKPVERPEGMPNVYATEIKVNSHAGPVVGAKVTLVPADGSDSKWPSGGTTNKQGIAFLKTLGQFSGVPEGVYKVLVEKTEGTSPAFDLVDPKFKNKLTTPLQIEVMQQKLNSDVVDVGAPVRVEIKASP